MPRLPLPLPSHQTITMTTWPAYQGDRRAFIQTAVELWGNLNNTTLRYLDILNAAVQYYFFSKFIPAWLRNLKSTGRIIPMPTFFSAIAVTGNVNALGRCQQRVTRYFSSRVSEWLDVYSNSIAAQNEIPKKWRRCNGFSCFEGIQPSYSHVPQTGMFTRAVAERSRSYAGTNLFFNDVQLAFHPNPAVCARSLFFFIPWNMLIFSVSSQLLISLRRFGQIPFSLPCFTAWRLWGNAALVAPLYLDCKLWGYV